MELGGYTQKFEGKKKNVTKEQELADQIYTHFHRAIAFPRLMKIISLTGYQSTYERFNTVRQGNARNKLALFLWLSKNEKPIWQE